MADETPMSKALIAELKKNADQAAKDMAKMISRMSLDPLSKDDLDVAMKQTKEYKKADKNKES